MAEPNAKIVKSRPRVPDAPVDGGHFNLSPSFVRGGSISSGPSAAKDVDPAIQESRNPVDSYKAKALPMPLA